MILRLGNHLQMTVFQGFGYFPGQRIFMDLITVIQPDIWIWKYLNDIPSIIPIFPNHNPDIMIIVNFWLSYYDYPNIR